MSLRFAQRFAVTMCAIPLVALAACSSSSDSGPSGGATASIPAAFTKYCAGTLKVKQTLMKSAGSGAWIGDGTMTAAAGSTFLVSPDFGHWGGYVFLDGVPAKIDADFDKGLIKDTDFTSDCAIDATFSDKKHTVVFGQSTIFPNKDLSGTACVLSAGTELTNYSFEGGSDGTSTVSSDEIKSNCSLTTGYSKDLQYGYALDK